jgi:N4-gp56 family major capsid protein
MAATLIADIPDAVLQVYSRKAILKAMPRLVFANFATREDQLGEESGERLNFLKYDNLTKGGKLGNETTPIPKRKLSESQVNITVDEYGNAVQVSRRALRASFRRIMDDIATLLGRDYALVLDEMIRDAYLTTANKFYGIKSNTATNQITSAHKLTTASIKDVIERMKTSNIPPMIRGGDQHFVGIFHPTQLRSLRDDAAWLSPHQYVDTAEIYNGEVGKYEGVVFIETTQIPALAGAGSGGIDVYRGLVFGEDAVGFSEPVPFELVDDGIEDFKRLQSIGWYSIMGAGIINDHVFELQTAGS